MNVPAGSNEIWNKVLNKDTDIISRKIAGELFLVPVRGKLADMQQIFTLNPVAEQIWQELSEGKSLKEIRSSIIGKFDVKEEETDSDLLEFVADLIKAGLVRE